MMKTFFLWRKKSQIQTYFDSQPHSSISRNENKGVETLVPEFSGILPGFSTNQNFRGCIPTPASQPPAPLLIGKMPVLCKATLIINATLIKD